MATIKIKFRASYSAMREGTLFFLVIHNRVVMQIRTDYKLYPQEWDNEGMEIICAAGTGYNHSHYLASLKTALHEDIKWLKGILHRFSV